MYIAVANRVKSEGSPINNIKNIKFIKLSIVKIKGLKGKLLNNIKEENVIIEETMEFDKTKEDTCVDEKYH